MHVQGRKTDNRLRAQRTRARDGRKRKPPEDPPAPVGTEELRFGGEALCFASTTRVLLKVLDNIIVMVLLCHSNECGCF